MTFTPIDAGAFVTLLLFIVAIIFHAGQLSARVEAIEMWQRDLRDDLRTIRNSLEDLKTRLITEHT
jgi:hypothetical protein